MQERNRRRLEHTQSLYTGGREYKSWWADAEATHNCVEWYEAREVMKNLPDEGPIDGITITRIDRVAGAWWMHDESGDADLIRFCPFCGVELPE